MDYSYRCAKCGVVVDVQRPLSDYERGPDDTEARHQGCDGGPADFSRILTAPSRIFVHESENDYWR